MRTFGHTVQRAVVQTSDMALVSLECTCGVVFASACCPLMDLDVQCANEEVYNKGKDKAAHHIALMQEVNKTSSPEQPCAA